MDIDISLYEEISESQKKEISNTSINAKLNNNIMNNINTNVNNNIRNVSTFNNKINNSNNDKLNKKILRTSRAMNRIKKNNQNENDNKIKPEILNSLQNLENRNSKRGVKYRQSFRIMEIAKQLEREIIKQDSDENREKEKKDEEKSINKKYRNSCVIDIISNKPIDNKKKKKNRISFMG